MAEIEYVDDEMPEAVAEIHGLMEQSDGRLAAIAVCTTDGLHFMTRDEASPAEIEEVRMQLTGLLEHFDELVAAAKINSDGKSDVKG